MSRESDLLTIQQANSMLMEMRKEAVAPPVSVRPPWWEVSPPKEFAGAAGTMRCNWCRNIFDRERRSLAEVEHLRKVLMIDMTTPFDPPICDTCYENVVTSSLPKEEVEKVGSCNNGVMSNNGVGNLVLRASY